MSAKALKFHQDALHATRAAVVEEGIVAGGSHGYNAATGEYVDMVKAGIVDSAKVVRSAMQNAASIASLLLTTECMITEMPETPAARSRFANDYGEND